MQVLAVLVVCIFAAQNIFAAQCPNGADIYEWGISEQGKNDVVNEHNKYRQMIMNGSVPKQPRGKNLHMLAFDDNLSYEGRKVSQTCKMNHIIASDDRWGWVGQNLHISWSSVNSPGQDWADAVKGWYEEHTKFIYPNTSNGVTGHYTQVVWAKSELVGCDFISFYDVDQPKYPYAKLYTCNYGPGGNFNNEPPYELA